MFALFSILFLQNAVCFYNEVEATLSPTDYHSHLTIKLESERYYWFEVTNEIYLLYFDRSCKFHESPFVLVVLVPGAKKENWPNAKACRLLPVAFDAFHETSAFFSLSPNNLDRQHYTLLVAKNRLILKGVVWLGEKTFFSVMDSTVPQELNHCTSFLENVKIGTRSWQRFYTLENDLYGLFVGTYFIAYRTKPAGSSFRSGGLSATGVAKFATTSVQPKVFLYDKENSSFVLYMKRNQQTYTKNQYSLSCSFAEDFVYDVVFDSDGKENKEKEKEGEEEQLKVSFEEPNQIKRTETPAIERLLQTGQRTYLFEDDFKQNFVIQLPMYYFGQRLEISSLFFWIKTVQENVDNVLTTNMVLKKYPFQEEKWKGSIKYDLHNYYVYVNYVVENGRLVFETNKVEDSKNNELLLLRTEVVGMDEGVETKGVYEYFNGAIVYDPESVFTLTAVGSHAEEQEKKQKKQDLETVSEKRSRNKSIYVLIGLTLFVGCCSVKVFLSHFRRQLYKKRKMFRNRTVK